MWIIPFGNKLRVIGPVWPAIVVGGSALKLPATGGAPG
jgi:hypothetical protein